MFYRKENTNELKVFGQVWHGFYPGYYLTFLGGALCTLASRAVRRGGRPLCLGRRPLKLAYDLATFATTRVVMGYLSFPFVLLELAPSLRLYTYVAHPSPSSISLVGQRTSIRSCFMFERSF